MTKTTAVLNSAQTKYQNTQALKRVWKTLDHYSCPYDYNFHLHTICSDGKLTPEEVVEQVIDIGLKGLAITDHHSIHGFIRAWKCLEKRQKQDPTVRIPHLWTGIEITSNLNGTKVHLLGYGFSPEHYSIKKYLTGEGPQGQNAEAKEVINSLHKAGGLAVLAHPVRYRRCALELISEAFALGIDGVETYYAYGNPTPWQPSVEQTKLVKQKAEEYNLFHTCGTDTHGTNLLVGL